MCRMCPFFNLLLALGGVMARRIVRGRVFFPEFADFLLFGEVTLKVPPFLLRDGCSDALKINICSPSSVGLRYHEL